LWWGQQIPAYYLPDGDLVVAKSPELALEKARELSGNDSLSLSDLRQDEDVLDTWFSSWLWPISVFDGIRNPDNEDIKYYYPTNDLITAPEILFFWVARMIMAGQAYRNDIPFKNVYLTGIVRDKLGRKMSKSLGNSPDPIELIGKFGADGVRVGMLLTSPAGNDLPFDESLCEQGRNFSNKVWNALRLVKGWQEDPSLVQPAYAAISVQWFESRLNESLLQIEENFDKYRLSEALMTAYKLVWDDFCSWYLEMVKPAYQQPIDPKTLQATIGFFEKLMKVLHPFMPFITEEIWHILGERSDDESIMVSLQPVAGKVDAALSADFQLASEVIIGVRNVRKEKNIAFKDQVEMKVKSAGTQTGTEFDAVIVKLGNISRIEYVDEKPTAAAGFMVKSNEYYIPLGEGVDLEAEREKLTKELEYTQGFLDSVMKKLGNERFVSNAKPEVVEVERKKLADAEMRIQLLKEQLAGLD
jgi:valyl-tRNA synthetase